MINESCRMHGTVSVLKEKGNLVFSIGDEYSHIKERYQELGINISNFNFSHKINSFAFGQPSYGVTGSLNGHKETQTSNCALKTIYFLNVVQILPEHKKFSYSSQIMKSCKKENKHFPSIQFRYDISPISLFYQRSKTLRMFLAELCSVLGGAFGVFCFIEWILFSLEDENKYNLDKIE